MRQPEIFPPPVGVSDFDWEAAPAAVRALLEQLINRVAQLEEQMGRSSRNSSKSPSSDGSGFKPPAKEKSKGSGRKRGGQDGHPGASRNLFPTEQCADVIPHFPTTCRGCGEALSGQDPEPHRHQVVDIPKIEPFVIEHQLHRLNCPHCHTTTCAELPTGVERGGFGPQLSAWVGLLGGAYHLSHHKVHSLLDQVLGVEISTGAINAIRNNPERKRGWLWVMVTPALAVFQFALSRSAEVAKQILGETFAGIVITDRYGAYSWLPLHRRQICWAHIKRDFAAIAERSGVSTQVGQRLLEQSRQLFHQWHRWREGQISREDLQAIATPIRQAIETTLREVSDLGVAKGEKTPGATTVRTCRQILKVALALWSFLDHPDVEPTNNAAVDEVFSVGVWALRPAVIHRKLSYGVQSQRGGLCQSRLLTVTTTLKLQERNVMASLVEA